MVCLNVFQLNNVDRIKKQVTERYPRNDGYDLKGFQQMV